MLPLENIIFTHYTKPDGTVVLGAELRMVVLVEASVTQIAQAQLPKETILDDMRKNACLQFWRMTYGDFISDLKPVLEHVARITQPRDLLYQFSRNVWMALQPNLKDKKLQDIHEVQLPKTE